MNSPIFQLLYFSRAVGSVRDEVVQDILWVSRVNNRQAGITGLLLYENFHFMQILEGPETEVREIFGKILRDKRHTNIITIFERSIPDRQFADWAMAHFLFTSEDAGLKDAFFEYTGDCEGREESYPDQEAAIEYVTCFEAILKMG